MTSDTLPSERLRMSFVARYGTALLATGAALLAGRVLGPLIGDYLPYIVVFPVIALSAWYCGLGPSAVATVLALVGLKYWFMSPFHTLGVVTVRQALGMLAFLVASGAIVALGEVRLRENRVLRQAQGDLEDRVQQRTIELDHANQGLRDLTARLMQLQDDERRRIARELHDSVGQMLAALSIEFDECGGRGRPAQAGCCDDRRQQHSGRGNKQGSPDNFLSTASSAPG